MPDLSPLVNALTGLKAQISAPVLFQGEPVTIERATDLARRGYGCIDTQIWEPNPELPGYLYLVRTRTPREVCKDLVAVLGEYPEGGEEGLHVFDWYTCVTCPTSDGGGCLYRHASNEPCRYHPECKGFLEQGNAPWPDGRIAVFSVRGSSEGDYVHVEVNGKLLMLAKTFSGRDAAWQFSRRIADLLGA